MLKFLWILMVLSALLLIVLVLMHSPKGDGIAGIGNAAQMFTSQKSAEKCYKLTGFAGETVRGYWYCSPSQFATNYEPQLLNFPVQGNRTIQPQTIAFAQKLNEAFPRRVTTNKVDQGGV